MSRILMVMISAGSLLFLLIFGFFSTLHFVTFHPVLKILSIGFFLQAHSFLLICLSQAFGKTLIACFYFCVFVPMNEIWGSCVRNVSSTLRWRRNSTHSEVLASKLTLQEVTLRSKRWGPMSGAFMRLNTKDSTNKCLSRASLAVYWLRLHVPGADARVFFFFFLSIYLNWRLTTLQYCGGFAKHQHESAVGVHVFSHPECPSYPSYLPPYPITLACPEHQL